MTNLKIWMQVPKSSLFSCSEIKILYFIAFVFASKFIKALRH